jgi:hypothetical protein
LDDPQDFFIAENIIMTDLRDALLGHAIATAEVAPVRDGNPQIVNIPPILVEHRVIEHSFPPSTAMLLSNTVSPV